MRRQVLLQPYGRLVLKQLIGNGSYGQIYRAVATPIPTVTQSNNKIASTYSNYMSSIDATRTANREQVAGVQSARDKQSIHINTHTNANTHINVKHAYESHQWRQLQEQQVCLQEEGQYQKQKQYAIKILSAETSISPTQTSQQACEQTLRSIQREIKILTLCSSHPRIVKCHSVEVVQEMIWIIMDYYQRGSLADIMAREKRTFSETEIGHILKGILQALEYLHSNGVIHRDIKAANVLVDQQGQVRVADFGVSSMVSYSHKHTRTGSPLWMSPELLANSKYSYKTDIWSLGITALELAEGVPPYSHQHPYRAIFSIQAHPPHSLTEPNKWSKEFNNFVTLCLTLDEKKRPSAEQLLKHPFVADKKYNHEDGSLKPQVNIIEQLPILQSVKNNCEQEEQQLDNNGTTILHDLNPNSNTENTSPWYKNVLPSLFEGGHNFKSNTNDELQQDKHNTDQKPNENSANLFKFKICTQPQYQHKIKQELGLQQSCKTFRIHTEHEQEHGYYGRHVNDEQNNNGLNLPEVPTSAKFNININSNNKNNTKNKNGNQLHDILNIINQDRTEFNVSLNRGKHKQVQIVEALYTQMEAEIKSVRAKYLKAIRSVQESTMLTFHGQLTKLKHTCNSNDISNNNDIKSGRHKPKKECELAKQKSITKLKKY